MSAYENDITITKQFNNVLTIPLTGLYSDRDAEFTIEAASASPSIAGGGIRGTATATGSSCAISTNTNNSNVSFTTECEVTRNAVTYSSDVEGWLSAESGDTVLASDTANATSTTYYINGVTLEAPVSGTVSFSITVPNGNSVATFVFTVDSSGNVVVTES